MLSQIPKFLSRALTGKPRPAVQAGQALYAACVAQSRQVAFYTDYGLKDEIGVRFEWLTLHVVMLVDLLRAENEQHKETSQALFDSLLLALDDTLREQGVGDLTVPKKMKVLIQTVYARLKKWTEIWAEGDEPAQTELLIGTVYALNADETADENVPVWAQTLSAYVTTVRQQLDINGLLAGTVNWPTMATVETALTQKV